MIVVGMIGSVLHLSSKVMKYSAKLPFTQAAQFGIGYGAATNIGYNLSNTYLTGGLRATREPRHKSVVYL